MVGGPAKGFLPMEAELSINRGPLASKLPRFNVGDRVSSGLFNITGRIIALCSSSQIGQGHIFYLVQNDQGREMLILEDLLSRV